MTKNIIITLVLLLMTPLAYSDEMPNSIDYFADKGVEVLFIEAYDPGYIVLELPGGMTIDTKYSGLAFEAMTKAQA